MITYHSIQDILELCEKEQKTFAQIIERADMEERAVTQEASYAKMQSMYEAMRHADATYDAKLTSASGLVGGDGEKLRAYNEAGKNLCGDFLGLVMEKAIKMAEGNACMRRIVAAPTAGSCGVIPAVFLTAQEKLACTEEQMVAAMYISAGVGAVIAENASIAGASGGCQAEIGSASAMAAAVIFVFPFMGVSRPLLPGWKLLHIEIAVCISYDLVEQLIGGKTVLIQGITFLRG